MKRTRLIGIFFLMVFLIMSTPSLPQANDLLTKRTTLKVNSITLADAFELLSVAYGIQFSYSNNVIPVHSLVSINIDNNTVEEALALTLRPLGINVHLTGTRVVLTRSRSAIAQTIRGSVTDHVTGVPLEGISIYVDAFGTRLAAVTTTDGKFRFGNVPVGRVILHAQSIGYESKSAELILVSGKEAVIEFRLNESVTAMNEVVVLGSRHEGIPGAGLAVTSARTFTLDETKRYAGSLGDPARMAASFAGVVAGSDESNALIVRGNSPRGILWRVDGIEVPNPNHFASEGASNGIVSVLSSNIIDNSDLITGSFPAQYGNALSGVLDMRLRSGNNERREHSAQVGALGLEVSTEGPLRKGSSSYLFNYRYSTLSVLDQMGVELNEVGQYKNYQDASVKIDLPDTRLGSWSLFAIGGRSVANRTDRSFLDNNSSDVLASGLNYRRIINDRTLLQSYVSFSGTRISRFNTITINNAGFEVKEDYTKLFTRASVTLRRKVSAKTYVEGGVTQSWLNYDFYLRTLDAAAVYQQVINFKEQGQTTMTQGFVFTQHYLSPGLSFFYGSHLLYFRLSDDLSIEPRGGMRWNVSKESSLSIAGGKHSRIENLQYYLARDHQTGGDEVQINKQLGFTRANHFSVAYSTTAFSASELKLEGYYQHLYNAPVQSDLSLLYTSINEDTGFITDTLLNSGKGRNYGIELSVERPFSRNFYYRVNGSLFRSLFSVNGVERSTAYDMNFAFHFLGGKEFVVGRNRNRLALNFKTSWAGGRPYVPIDTERSVQKGEAVFNWEQAYKPRLSNYFRMDAQASYRINYRSHSVEVKLEVQNFTDHHNSAYYYFDHTTSGVRLKEFVGVVPVFSVRVDF